MQKIIYEHNKNTTKAFRNERKLPVNWKFQEGIKEILLLGIQTRAALILSNLLTKTLIIKSKSQYDVYHDSFINSVIKSFNENANESDDYGYTPIFIFIWIYIIMDIFQKMKNSKNILLKALTILLKGLITCVT